MSRCTPSISGTPDFFRAANRRQALHESTPPRGAGRKRGHVGCGQDDSKEKVMKRFIGDLVGLFAILGFVYVLVAAIVFDYRHPWMTDTEKVVYGPRALTFQTVRYSEARPREINSQRP
jgi:hypothetical protein